MKSFLVVIMVAFCIIMSGCKEEKVDVTVQATEKPKAEKYQSVDISKIVGGWKSLKHTRYGSRCAYTLLITNDSVLYNGSPNKQPKRTYYKIMEDKSIMVYQTGGNEWFSITILPSGNIQTFGFSDDDEYVKVSYEEVERINTEHENYLEDFYRNGGKNSPNYEPITDFVPEK